MKIAFVLLLAISVLSGCSTTRRRDAAPMVDTPAMAPSSVPM